MVVGVVMQCGRRVRVRGRDSRSSATENTYSLCAFRAQYEHTHTHRESAKPIFLRKELLDLYFQFKEILRHCFRKFEEYT